jgi:hypothetical protein
MDMNMDMMTDLFVKAMAGGLDSPEPKEVALKKESGDAGLDMMFMMMDMMGEMMKSESAPPPPGMGSVPPPPSPFPPQAGMMPPQGSPFPQPMAPAVPMFPGVNAPPPGQVAMPGMMPQQAMPGMMPQQAMPGMMPMGGNPMDPLAGADGSMQAALTDISTTGNISNANLMNLSAGIGTLHKNAIPLANQAAMSKAAQQHTSPQAIMGASQQAAATPAAATGALGGALPGQATGAGAGGIQAALGGALAGL